MLYPFGGELLAVNLDRKPVLANRLIAAGGRLHRDGDGDQTVVFHKDLFEVAAQMLWFRKRRTLSEKRKQVLREHGAKDHFKPSNNPPNQKHDEFVRLAEKAG